MQITGMLHGARLLEFVGFPATEVLGTDAGEEAIRSLLVKPPAPRTGFSSRRPCSPLPPPQAQSAMPIGPDHAGRA